MRCSVQPDPRLAALDLAAFDNTSLISPLRYPGGKRRLLPYIARAVADLPCKPSILIEPFAGGCSVSVGLLEHGFVPRIGIADADPLVASFWMAVFDPKLASLLAEMVADTPLSLSQWERIRSAVPRTVLGRAFQCLYLNRANFSGILHRTAGPIGGRTQAGTYNVGSRFPRERLAKRILKLSQLSPRVSYVRCQDWRTTLTSPLAGTDLVQLGRMFSYLDPPFWKKANKLYRHFFDEREHRALAKVVGCLKGNWVLSYDMDPSVIGLYGKMPGIHSVNMRYTASERSASHKSQELLFSNLAVAHGLANRSLAVLQGGVNSAYIHVQAGAAAEQTHDANKQVRVTKAA